MARTAADVALLLSAMAGPDPRAPLSQRSAALDLAPPFDVDLQGRRVAWSPALNGLPVDPAVIAVLEPAVAGLAALGLDVTADEPDLAGADTVFETWRAFGFALSLGELYDSDGDRMKETVRWNVERGRALTVADLTTATRLHAGLHDRALAFFDRYDYLACPVTQVEPFPVEVEYPADVAGVAMRSYLEWMRVCSRISVTGCPAISIPAGLSAGGLPVGLQLVARPFAERSLLEVAHAVDAAAASGGRPVVALRVSDADARDRHRGVSHHSLTALARASRRAAVAVPDDEDPPDVGQHDVVRVAVPHIAALLDDAGLHVTTMGRGPADEPRFFRYAAAAGTLAASLMSRQP
jgi:amidase